MAQVISAKNDKTIIINFDSFKEHPLYRKRVRKTSRIVAHDEEGKAGLGDVVRIVPCAPVSKTKRFRLDAIVKKFGFLVDEVSRVHHHIISPLLSNWIHHACACRHIKAARLTVCCLDLLRKETGQVADLGESSGLGPFTLHVYRLLLAILAVFHLRFTS